MAGKIADQTDRYVGSRVRMRRIMIGMTQESLARGLGLTFQQVQKYEKGTNRISAGRLNQLSGILSVPVPFFFEGGPDTVATTQNGEQTMSLAAMTDFLANYQGQALLRAFQQIKSPIVRRSIVSMVETIAERQGADI